jgi:tetratricopeptide (TPR) repeat protein
MDPGAVEPMYLALGAMNAKVPEAEAMVLHYLAAKVPAEVRMAYLRNLLDSQRVADGYVQAQRLTLEWPDFSDGWLIRGSLEFQAQQWAQAEASLKMGLAHDPEPSAGTETQEMGRGTVQALLLLAQITEQTQRLDEAKAYLARIDSPKDALRVALRQASILARQGKLEEARALIRSAPEVQPEDDRVKINAEVQLLRDHKDYAAAYQRMAEGMARYPQDSDLAYDQAMLAEKLGKTSEMEQLLRSVIAAKPNYYHAYNALGFSFAERNVQLDEARQLILKALEMAPDDPFIVDSLAWVEFRTGNSVEALRLLRGAFKSRPDPEIAAHMGEVLWTMGQRAQALSVWQQGAELSPDNATLLETTARLQGTR